MNHRRSSLGPASESDDSDGAEECEDDEDSYGYEQKKEVMKPRKI